jgi:hypothetical protein
MLITISPESRLPSPESADKALKDFDAAFQEATRRRIERRARHAVPDNRDATKSH